MGVVIWTFVGLVAAAIGLFCFSQGSTYDLSFRKLGRYVGGFVYLSVFIIMLCLVVEVEDHPVLKKVRSWCLAVGAKSIPVPKTFQSWCLRLAVGGKSISVPKKFQSGVGAILFVLICSISVVHDKYVTGISDAFTIISYGSFALMSLSMSKKLKLGFETGFTNFFLQLFAAQLFKIKWFLMLIALFFCSFIIILRHCPEESEEQGTGSNTPDKGSHDTNASPMRNGTGSNSRVSPETGDDRRIDMPPPALLELSESLPQNGTGTVEGDINSRVSPETGEDRRIDMPPPALLELSESLPQNGTGTVEGDIDMGSRVSPETGEDRRIDMPPPALLELSESLPQNGTGTVEGDIDEESQVSLEKGEVSGQRQLSTNKKQNIQEESSEAVGEVLEENISDGDDDQIALLTGSLAVEFSYSSDVDLVNRFAPPQLRRRTHLGDTTAPGDTPATQGTRIPNTRDVFRERR